MPETGALVIIGYPKFGGGLGGYARYVAVCPPDWPYGTTIGPGDAPLPKADKPLRYDEAAGMRVRENWALKPRRPQPPFPPDWFPSDERLRPSWR